MIIYPQFEDAGNFSEGLAKTKLYGKYGFINRENTVIIPREYNNAGDFSEGLANVELNDRWGFINESGKEIIPFIYDNAAPFGKINKGKAFVRRNGKSIDIDKKGVEYDN